MFTLMKELNSPRVIFPPSLYVAMMSLGLPVAAAEAEGEAVAAPSFLPPHAVRTENASTTDTNPIIHFLEESLCLLVLFGNIL
ncbi:hypothetical protein D3C71_1396340 [compost metagenome]